MKQEAWRCFGALLLAGTLLSFSACAGKGLRDGVFTGVSGEDDGAYGEALVTISGGKATGCIYVTRQRDGTIKDEDYGKINGEISNQDYYDKAQLAVRAMSQYARRYAETGDLRTVEAVSGATISYHQFLEAVEQALDKARK
jgi:major membrane immunogen (membrane-anchored lipoprotein)